MASEAGAESGRGAPRTARRESPSSGIIGTNAAGTELARLPPWRQPMHRHMNGDALSASGTPSGIAMRRRALPYLLILPSIVALLALIIYPLLFSLKNSFYLWNLQTSPVP